METIQCFELELKIGSATGAHEPEIRRLLVVPPQKAGLAKATIGAFDVACDAVLPINADRAQVTQHSITPSTLDLREPMATAPIHEREGWKVFNLPSRN